MHSQAFVCSPPPSPPSLPGCGDEEAACCADEILSIHRQLLGLEDLRPGPRTDLLLGRLVAICCQPMSSTTVRMILVSPELQLAVPILRDICSRAESELETFWASEVARAVNAKDAWRRLSDFPYLDNYADLTHMELCAMRAVSPVPPQSIAFFGSGPLPLTSMALLGELSPNQSADLQQHILTVTNIDISSSAIDASRSMCETLGVSSDRMLFRHAAADDQSLDLIGFDAVYLAALVGASQHEKAELIESVARRMKPGALLVIRSCQGLKTILYPEVDIFTPRLIKLLDTGATLHPHGKVVNSVIVARVKFRMQSLE